MSTLRVVVALSLLALASSFSPSHVPARAAVRVARARPAIAQVPQEKPSVEEVTEKYGLEAGLFSAFKRGGSGDGGDEDGKKSGAMATAGDLLKRYGGAYLLTSTSLAVVSFSFCYWAISNGVDVASLLQRVGIEARTTLASRHSYFTMAIFFYAICPRHLTTWCDNAYVCHR